MSHYSHYRLRHQRIPVRYDVQSRAELEAELALDEQCVASLTERLSRGGYDRWQAESADRESLRKARLRVAEAKAKLAPEFAA